MVTNYLTEGTFLMYLQAYCCFFYLFRFFFTSVVFISVMFISCFYPPNDISLLLLTFRSYDFFCVFCLLFLILPFRFNTYLLRGNSQVFSYSNSVCLPLQNPSIISFLNNLNVQLK